MRIGHVVAKRSLEGGTGHAQGCADQGSGENSGQADGPQHGVGEPFGIVGKSETPSQHVEQVGESNRDRAGKHSEQEEDDQEHGEPDQRCAPPGRPLSGGLRSRHESSSCSWRSITSSRSVSAILGPKVRMSPSG